MCCFRENRTPNERDAACWLLARRDPPSEKTLSHMAHTCDVVLVG